MPEQRAMDHSLETVLSVDNIRVKAYHGYYAAERKIGGMYSITVQLYRSIDRGQLLVDLDSTVNYEVIYNEVLTIMKQRFDLIETSCKAIFDRMKELSADDIWKVTVVKENPPLKYVGATRFEIKG